MTITSEYLKPLQQRSEENIFSPNLCAYIVHSYTLCFIRASFFFPSQSTKQEEREKKKDEMCDFKHTKILETQFSYNFESLT